MSSIDTISLVAAIVALLVAIIGHEIMHGLVAYKYGDTTAKDSGRLSINPLIHIDPFGSVLVPLMTYFIPVLMGADSGFLFGWAKPVPVNMSTVIKNGGYNGAMGVSMAGVIYNIFMATLASIIIMTFLDKPISSDSILYIFIYIFLIKFVVINVVLAVLNTLPVPGFDGSRFLSYLSLKMGIKKIAHFFDKAEPYGMIIIIIILVTPLKIPLFYLPVQIVLGLLLT